MKCLGYEYKLQNVFQGEQEVRFHEEDVYEEGTTDKEVLLMLIHRMEDSNCTHSEKIRDKLKECLWWLEDKPLQL